MLFVLVADVGDPVSGATFPRVRDPSNGDLRKISGIFAS